MGAPGQGYVGGASVPHSPESVGVGCGWFMHIYVHTLLVAVFQHPVFKLASQVGKRKGRPSFEGGSRAGSCTPFSRRHARVRSGLEDTRPSCVCVCVCGRTCARMCSSPAALLGQGRPYRDRAPSKQMRENGGRTQIGPHLSVLGLRSAWSPRRRPSESSLLGDLGRHPRGGSASPG